MRKRDIVSQLLTKAENYLAKYLCLINFFYLTLLLTIIYLLAAKHLDLIIFKWPLEYGENVELYRTILVSQGVNLYDGASLPAGHSQYGFLYNWISIPFLNIFGLSFTGPRTVSAIFNLLSAFVLATYAHNKKLGTPLVVAVFTWAYASTFTHTSNFLSYPVGVGGFFFLISVLIPLHYQFSKWSLVFSLVASLLGFFSKLYFGFGPAFIVIYLLIKNRILTAAAFTFVGLFLYGITITVIHYVFPYYYETTIKLSISLPTWSGLHLLKQIRYFFKLFSLTILSIAFTYWLSPKDLRRIFLNSFGFISFLTALIILLKMGGNEGAYYLYFYNILFPFIAIMLIDWASLSIIIGRYILMGLVGNIIIFMTIMTAHTPLPKIANSFTQIEQFARDKKSVLLNSPASFLQIIKGEMPDDPGQVRYLAFTDGFPKYSYEVQQKKIADAKSSRFYELIFTDNIEVDKENAILNLCYLRIKRIELSMYNQYAAVDVWIPKSTCDSISDK